MHHADAAAWLPVTLPPAPLTLLLPATLPPRLGILSSDISKALIFECDFPTAKDDLAMAEAQVGGPPAYACPLACIMHPTLVPL